MMRLLFQVPSKEAVRYELIFDSMIANCMLIILLFHITQFIVSELPKLLCRLSYKGDLEKVKQLFQCVTHQNVSEEKMGVQNSGLDKEQGPKLVDAICNLDRPLTETNTVDFGSNSNNFFLMRLFEMTTDFFFI